ncbi:unnamed protein product [Plutella xylostella]|uniref:(diamondback moth) hypothetical protein n=1 Tax=Plutella xylostella TaxID=51655 RepID=A0A8S4FMV2_PLUXY|nr:unnamed protein product [Plutella xylostella]
MAYSDEETYEVSDCTELDVLICKKSILQTDSCEKEILRNKNASSCSVVPIKCPQEEILEISPRAIYMYFNKTTEVKIKCGKHGIKRLTTRESEEKIIIIKLDIDNTESVKEMELNYDPSKISRKLNQLKAIEQLQTQETHNLAQSKVCKKPWTSNSGGDSQLIRQGAICNDIEMEDNQPINNPIMVRPPISGTTSHIVITPWTSKNERSNNRVFEITQPSIADKHTENSFNTENESASSEVAEVEGSSAFKSPKSTPRKKQKISPADERFASILEQS